MKTSRNSHGKDVRAWRAGGGVGMMGLSWKGRDAGGVGCSGDGWAVFTQKVAFGLQGVQRGWFFLAFYLFIYLAVLRLRCCLRLFLWCPGCGRLSGCGDWAPHCRAFCFCRAQALGCVISAGAVPGLWSRRPVVVVCKFSCSVACGILPDRGSNPSLLHRQADSIPLSP